MDTTGSLILPPQGSSIAPEIDALFSFIFYVTLFFFVLVVALVTYFSWRYRKTGKAELTSGVAHNLKLELLWTIIPSIIVLIIFAWGFKTYLKMAVVPKDALEIKVTGQRWLWTIDYPYGRNTVNELVVPVDKPIKLLMSSTDVIHSFYVPAFRLKKDVLPNRYTILWFEASKVGHYELYCAEYCGQGHSQMLGTVRVLSEREYDEWLQSGDQGGAGGLTLEQQGAGLYKSRACYTCHTVDGTTKVGPSFREAFNHQVTLADGRKLTVDENYLRESILDPQAKVVAGFQPVMPTYQGVLKDREIDALIAYIKSLEK
jgi:cytochrome c oxidase subunit 2